MGSDTSAAAPIGRIATAMLTPFAADGSLDLDGARALARHLVENGSDGLVMTGTTGEAPTMTDAEKLAFYEAVIDEVGGEAHLVAGTGTYDTAHCAHLTREAAKLGVEAFLAVTPYYSKPPPEGIVRHFAAIADAAGGRPVIAYNIPQRVVLNLPPELLERLAREVPSVIAVKQATTDLDQARAIVAMGLALYAGNDDLVLPFAEIGGCGGICVASHLIGRELGRVVELVQSGDVGGARALEAELHQVFDALAVTVNPIPVKAAMALCGHRVGEPRLPLVAASDDETARIRVMLERRGLLLRA